MTQIKQKLWDKELKFTDGTHFNGDKFRMKDLIDAYHKKPSEITFKLVSFEQINILLVSQKVEEIYIFLTLGINTNHWRAKTYNFKEFYIKYSKDILQVIQ